MSARRPRVAVLLPYWSFWAHTVPFDLREDREALARRVAALLGGGVELVGVATVDGEDEAAAHAARFAGAEAVLVLQSMAVPPAYANGVLERLPDAGVLVWGVDRQARVADDFDHGAITAEGATVGVPMIVATLVRAGRPVELVLGLAEDPAVLARVREGLRIAAAAARVRRARVGAVGGPQPGYVHVGADADALAAQVGPTVVPIAPAELSELHRDVAEERVDALEAETRAAWAVAPEVGQDGLRRSLRAACAIEDLVARHRLDAGSLNCHVAEIRFGEEIGIAPCFGLGRSTTAGVPWTCAGDLVTAVAMLCLKALGAPALYHELEALDWERGEFVVANTGEHDLALAPAATPQLVENRWFAADAHRGVCACLAPPAGPATIVGFVQLDAPRTCFRLIVGAGAFSGRAWPGVGTPNAGFRFADAQPPAAWERWCLAGATHHSALSAGDHAPALMRLGRRLGLDAVQVS